MRPESLEQLLKSITVRNGTRVGYWSGLNSLSGISVEKYHKLDEFKLFRSDLNYFVQESSYSTAEGLVKDFNQGFLNLRDKARELVQEGKEKGYEPIILSHASTSYSIEAAKRLQIPKVVRTLEIKYKNKMFDRICFSALGRDKNAVKEIFDGEELIFIGNGRNDISLAESLENSFLIENKPYINYENLVTRSGSFNQALKYLKEQ